MILRNKRGFTLIELLVVIAIIGILASVVLVSLNSARQRGRDARRVADLNQIRTALELYANDNGGAYPATYPGDLTGGGYMTTVPTDPTTQANYTYARCGTNNTTFVVRATLERNDAVLAGAPTGTICTQSCAHAAAPFYYCVTP